MIAVWLVEFAGLAALIFFSGRQLSVYGSMLAELLGLGKAWIGLALMASVTSLPELTVGISSAAVVGSADLALGDVLGSCCFNLFLLAVMDALVPGKPLSSQASTSHILAGAMSLILVALVGLGMILPEPIVLSKWIGLSSLAFVIVYFLSMRLLYRFEIKIFQQQAAREMIRKQEVPVTLKRALLTYTAHAGVVVGAALLLPGLARNLAEATGLGESFVGTLFLAASTSLPEAAVSISAIRLGAYDLAIGNLIGSNMFNIIILAVDDFFYTQGHLLKDAASSNMITVFSVQIMTALAIAGLMYRSSNKYFILAWDALLIGAVYVANLVLLYYLRPAG